MRDFTMRAKPFARQYYKSLITRRLAPPSLTAVPFLVKEPERS